LRRYIFYNILQIQDDRTKLLPLIGNLSISVYIYAFLFTYTVHDGRRTLKIKASYGENKGLLEEIKSRYDPENLFHVNQNIKPKVSGQATPSVI
jgi:hypothetical protein